MFLVSVPNYSVHKFNKDYYSVALTNGNIGAGLVHKNDFDKFVQEHGGKDYRKPAKRIAAGLAAVGLVTAGIMFRKPIKEVAVKVFNAVKNSEVFQKVSQFAKENFGKVKTDVTDAYKNLKHYTVQMFDNIKAFATRASERVQAPKALK